jgi:hypothetical protein
MRDDLRIAQVHLSAARDEELCKDTLGRDRSVPHDAELDEALRAIARCGDNDSSAGTRALEDLTPWFEQYEERAAILEFEANLPRAEAEARARAMTVAAFQADFDVSQGRTAVVATEVRDG